MFLGSAPRPCPTKPSALFVRLRSKRPAAAWLAAFWLLSASLALAELGRPIVRTFGPRETGGGNEIWAITQGEQGRLYCGSDAVLVFDGERWQQHRIPGSYAVRALALGPDRLWVGAVNEIGYFPRDPDGRLGDYQSLVAHLPADTGNLDDIWHVFLTDRGTCFVASDRVIVWDGTRAHVHPLAGARRLPSTQIDGRVYLSHSPTGLWQLGEAGLEPFFTADAIAHLGTFWIEKTSDGFLLVTPRGLFRLADDRLSPLAPETSAFLRDNIPAAACRLRNGDLAIGTLHGGLAIVGIDGTLKRVLDADDGLPAAIYSLFADREGALWIGSNAGLTRAALDTGTSLFDANNGLDSRVMHAFADREQRLFVATAAGVFSLPLDDRPDGRFSAVPEMPLRYYDIAGTPEGIYVSSFKTLERIDRTGAHPVFASERDTILIHPSRTDPGAFLIVENPDLVRLAPDANGTLQREWSVRLPDAPVELVEQPDGLWAATRSRGVFHLPSGPQPNPIPFRPASASPDRASLVGELHGSLVVCVDGEILVRQSGHFTPVPGAPATDPIAISNPDPSGRVWIALASTFSDGERVPVLGRLSLDSAGRPIWETFATPGLPAIGGLIRLYADTRGILWAGGSDALLRLDPAQLRPSTAPAPPLVHTRLSNGARLRHNSDPIALEFATLEFGRRESVRFQSRLSGPGAVWSAPDNNTHLTLAGLRDGNYEFALRTINDAGQTSPATTLRFSVLPPWYRTPAALAGWIALAALGFFGGIQWRSAYLRRRNAQLEQLVRRKTEQLEKANAAKSEFLANMSHEIRNPISGILGLSLAMEETDLDERQRKVSESIHSCAKLLSTLVEDVLDFSKIEAGKIDLRPAPFSLRDAFDHCAAIVAEDARAARSSIAVELAPDLPTHVVGDMPRVQQIVLNYLSNAVKFGAGQPIAIGATRIGGDRVRLFVRDRGPGLSESEIASLFTKFSRLPQAHAANIRGSGLGLAVCRLLTTKMGGEVGVDSQPGAGSCFWAEIPLPPAPGDASAPTRTATAIRSADPLHALIVEDIDYNALAMQAVLRRIGIDSEVAADGFIALEKLRSSAYDVVFMDWHLPGMIGTEVVSRYRAEEPPHRRTIIIATTAYSADFNREACLAAGMDAFIAKPFTPEKIAAALAELRGSFRAAVSVEIGARPEAPPPPPPENPPGFDLQMLRFLADDATGGLPTQIARYLAGFDADVDALRDAIARHNSAEIHRRAHRCVSHANMVKHEPLARLARELQAHAASPTPGRRQQLLADFDRELSRFKETLARSNPSSAPA